MSKMDLKEITFELTNYCPYECPYCSSDTTKVKCDIQFLKVDKIISILSHNRYGRIILSGGEPLSHPDFYQILRICKQHTDDVLVYTNELTHIGYNPSVIDGIYVEANLTLLSNVDELHILKRIKQGREAKRPEVKYSGNWDSDKTKCEICEDRVVRPNSKITKRPCDKYTEVE